MKRTLGAAIVITLVTSASLVSTGTSAQAYCTTTPKWARPSAVTVQNSSSIPAPWDAILVASAKQWSNIPGSTFDLTAVGRFVSGPHYGGGVSHASHEQHVPQAPGFAITNTRGNTITSATVVFNPRWHFNDTGVFDQTSNPPKADVRTVLVHELGHWLKLKHPSDCGAMTAAERAAAMNPAFVKRWNVAADDKAGAAAMY